MTIEQAVKEYLNKTKDEVIIEMQAQDFYASTKSARSLRVDGTQLIGSKSFGAMMFGRPPGKMPPIEPIEKWIKARSIKLSAWAVVITIKKYGTQVWRGERAGLDLTKAFEENKDEFIKNIGKGLVANFLTLVRSKTKPQ